LGHRKQTERRRQEERLRTEVTHQTNSRTLSEMSVSAILVALGVPRASA
jgi:hypothetical protein